jgi:hypothetical protein
MTDTAAWICFGVGCVVFLASFFITGWLGYVVAMAGGLIIGWFANHLHEIW